MATASITSITGITSSSAVIHYSAAGTSSPTLCLQINGAGDPLTYSITASGISKTVTGLSPSTSYKAYIIYYDGGQKFSSAYWFTTEGAAPSYYTVSLSASSGGSVSGGGSYTYGQTCTIRATPYAGYVFDGWYDSYGYYVSGSSSYSFTVTGDVSLTAIFAPITYYYATLRLYANGGSFNGADYMDLDDYNTTGSNITFPLANGTTYYSAYKPTRAGYTFSHYYNSGAPNTPVYSKSIKPTTSGSMSSVYASWIQDTHTFYLTLNGNGGSWNGQTSITDSATVTGTSYVFSLSQYAEPVRSGYRFLGWYTAASYGSKVTTVSVNTGSPSGTVYAHWIRQYTVTAYSTSTTAGTVSGGGTFDEGSYCTLYASAKTGYQFDYWYSGSTIYSYSSTYDHYVDSSITLYAHFSATTVTYQITYNPNGGSGSAITDNVTGVPQSGYISATLRGQTFTKAYSTQTGWHTSGGTNYDLGESISINANLTLYATWLHDSTDNFYWLGSEAADGNAQTGIVQGAPVTNMTATAWKRIGTKIRALQALLGDTQSTFTTSMTRNSVFRADYYNEVVNALNAIKNRHSLSVSVPDSVQEGNRLFYYLFNGAASIKQCLNNIIQWYNTR